MKKFLLILILTCVCLACSNKKTPYNDDIFLNDDVYTLIEDKFTFKEKYVIYEANFTYESNLSVEQMFKNLKYNYLDDENNEYSIKETDNMYKITISNKIRYDDFRIINIFLKNKRFKINLILCSNEIDVFKELQENENRKKDIGKSPLFVSINCDIFDISHNIMYDSLNDFKF